MQGYNRKVRVDTENCDVAMLFLLQNRLLLFCSILFYSILLYSISIRDHLYCEKKTLWH